MNEGSPGRKWQGWMLWLPLVITAAVYLSTCNRAVIDYDEAHYAQAALQMVQRGDWVTPYDNGVRFLEKPPFMYWATAASFRIFGINEFALRLPTGLGVIILVWVVMLMARSAGDDMAAMIAGLCTSFSAGVFLFTRESLHDIWLVLFLTTAMYAFLRWYNDRAHSLRHALLFCAAMAGAVMTKSLVGIAFPVGIVLLFFVLRREWPDWRRLHIVPGLGLFLALVVPWHWLAAMRNQDFLWSFFLNEQILRFFGKHDPPILWSIPLLLFWGLIPVWFFPWTAFLPAALKNLRNAGTRSQAVMEKLALAWLIVILGFYAVSARLEHYAFPLLPALALLVGIALSRTDPDAAAVWGFRALAILGGVMLLAGTGAGIWLLASSGASGDAAATRVDVISSTDFSILADMPGAMQRELRKPAVVTVICLAAAFWAAFRLEKRKRRLPAILSVTAGMLVLCAMTQWSLVLCEDLISSRKFGLAVAREARPGDHLVVLGDYESANSISFYQPLLVQVSDGVAYSLAPGMKFPDAPRIELPVGEFRALWQAGERVFVLLPKTRMSELNPAGIRVLEVLDRALVRNR
jgi:4-amino-4-deoxy-L-arabinose transferase-like glycosyltransferase